MWSPWGQGCARGALRRSIREDVTPPAPGGAGGRDAGRGSGHEKVFLRSQRLTKGDVASASVLWKRVAPSGAVPHGTKGLRRITRACASSRLAQTRNCAKAPGDGP